MRWIKIDKAAATAPAGNSYKQWKSALAAEARNQCVYCAIHEACFGGAWNYHVEHFRPKSEFPELEHTFSNLYYACAICNVFKGASWPRDPEPKEPSFLDPSAEDYNTIFEVAPESFQVSAASVAGKYMVERLYLNRPQLLLERRSAHLAEAVEQVLLRFRKVVAAHVLPPQILQQLALVCIELTTLLNQARGVVPYTMADTKR